MKLLSPLAQKDKQQEETVRKILRTQETEELAKKANIKLARAEADFNEALARNRSKWALEEEEHAKRILHMSDEVAALENRKKDALVPISMYKEEVDKTMAEAKNIVARAKEKEENVDYLTEKLEEKLTEVGDRENAVAKEEQRQTIAKEGIESQKEQVRSGVKQLSQEMLDFHVCKEKEEANISERKKEVALAEINVVAQAEKNQRDLDAMKIWDIQLKDERATLDREYARRKFPHIKKD